MEKEYYIEFRKRQIKDPKGPAWDYSIIEDYDYIWAKTEEEAKDIIESIYAIVEITLIEEYYDDMTDILRGIAND